MSKLSEEGCRKAFFLEGWIKSFVHQVRSRFLEQDSYIRKLEERIAHLESAIIVGTKEKT